MIFHLKIISGDSSKTRGIVVKKWDFDADIKTGAGALFLWLDKNNWILE